MIDISQWRARIGLWYCRKNSLWETSTDTTPVLSGEGFPRNRVGSHNVMSSLVLFLLLLILSGDIELNPGPKTELTSTNALRLLVKNGFIVEDKWTKLTSLLGVSLKERKRLETMASSNQDYHFALEQSLQWWITNSTNPSWEKLVSAVETCGDMNVQVANMMKRQVDTKDEVKDASSLCPSILQTRKRSKDASFGFRRPKEKKEYSPKQGKISKESKGTCSLISISESKGPISKNEGISLYVSIPIKRKRSKKPKHPFSFTPVQKRRKDSSKLTSEPMDIRQFDIGSQKQVIEKDNHTDELSDFPLLFEKLTTIHDVLKKLAPICVRWREIGNGLGMDFYYLDGLAKDITISNQIRLEHVLQKWKDLDSPAAPVTWKTVIDVVKGPLVENKALANKMYEYLKHKTSTVTSPCFPNQSPKVLSYANYLREIYLKQIHKRYPKWPPVQMTDFINLLWINKAGVAKKEERVMYEHIIQGDIDYVEGTKAKMTFADLANLKDGKQPQCIVVEGAPGSGKTLFSWEVCSRWAKGEILQQYSVVSLLQLRGPEVQEASKIADLFPNSDENFCKKVKDIYGQGAFILLDGFDELPEDKRKDESFFMKLLTGKVLPFSTVMVTSRPWATNNLVETHKHCISQQIEIVGFTENNVDDYITQAFPDEIERSAFQQYLKQYPYIHSVMYIPLNCAIVVEVFRESGSIEDAPKTLTQLYTNLVKTALLRYLYCHPIYKEKSWYFGNDFKRDLPNEVYQKFLSLCQVAYEGVKEKQLTFNHLAEDFESFNLMQKVEHIHISCGQSYSYNFLHLSIQEYLAAYYITSKGAKSTDLGKMVMRFLSGLTGYFNVEKMEDLDVNDCHCIYESQNVTLLRDQEVVPLLDVDVYVILTDMYIVGSCIALSKHQWVLIIEHTFITDDHLEMLYAGINAQNKVTGCIRELALENNKITSTSIDHLTKLPIQSLIYLNLSMNILDNEGCDKLANLVPLLPHLIYLNISQNNITPGGHMNLLNAIGKLFDFNLALSSPSEEECYFLMSLANLESLCLCNLDEIEALATGLASNTTLPKLLLYFNALAPAPNTLYPYLYSSLTTNHTLKKLVLLNTNLRFDPEDISPRDNIVEEVEEFYLADLIKDNSTIEKLYLVIDTLSEMYISKIADSLKENRTIKKLVLYKSCYGMICDHRVKFVDHQDIYYYIKTH